MSFFPENFQYFDRKVSTFYERKIWVGQSCEEPVFRVADTALLIWLKSFMYRIDKNAIYRGWQIPQGQTPVLRYFKRCLFYLAIQLLQRFLLLAIQLDTTESMSWPLRSTSPTIALISSLVRV